MINAKEDAMTSDHAATISVHYRHIEGYHVFTSEDVYGLYIANKDAKDAYEAVAPALEALIKLNDGIDCKIRAALSYPDFIERLRADAEQVAIPSTLADSYFVMDCAA